MGKDTQCLAAGHGLPPGPRLERHLERIAYQPTPRRRISASGPVFLGVSAR